MDFEQGQSKSDITEDCGGIRMDIVLETSFHFDCIRVATDLLSLNLYLLFNTVCIARQILVSGKERHDDLGIDPKEDELHQACRE